MPRRTDAQLEADAEARSADRADAMVSKPSVKPVEPEKEPAPEPVAVYGEDIVVETVGETELMDFENDLLFPHDKAVRTKFTRFVESALAAGKLKEGASEGVDTVDLPEEAE